MTESQRALHARRGAAGASTAQVMTPVGLGPRATAFALDYLPIAVYLAVLVVLGVALRGAFPDTMARPFAHAAWAQAIGFALVTLPVALYFALSEASAWRATWGNRRLGLIVVASAGARLGLGRALARSAVKSCGRSWR